MEDNSRSSDYLLLYDLKKLYEVFNIKIIVNSNDIILKMLVCSEKNTFY